MRIRTTIQNIDNYKIYLLVWEAVNKFMRKKGYLKIDLPVLSPALIPESYLEIFETKFNYFRRNEKLYLTPSSELFLKRLIVYGIGNCYCLGKAFRNSEPNSSLHSPEFTMLEYYKVGCTYLEMADEILEMMKYINKVTKRKIINVKAKDNEFVYQNKIVSLTRWEKFTVSQAFEKYADINEETLFNHSLFLEIAEKRGYKTLGFTYQDIFSQIIAQEVEPNLGMNGYPTMLYNYPKEMSSLAKLGEDGKIAKRAEFYIYGIEIGGWCEELNDWQEQKKRFATEKAKRKENKLVDHTVDNGFIEALKYGLPGCTGVGIGFDRLAMIFADCSDINSLHLISLGKS